MKTGPNKFIQSHTTTINLVVFRGLVTIRNGLISEEIEPKSEIYEKYIIGIDQDSWDVLVTNNQFKVISHSGLLLDNVCLELTTKDKKIMKKYRDLCLCYGPECGRIKQADVSQGCEGYESGFYIGVPYNDRDLWEVA